MCTVQLLPRIPIFIWCPRYKRWKKTIDLETSGDFASGDFHEWTDDEDDEDEIMNDEDEIEDDDEDEGDDDDDDDDHDGYIWW